jgi:hypothetical protein
VFFCYVFTGILFRGRVNSEKEYTMMPKLLIIAGPDRLAFVTSLLATIDAVPMPGYMIPPHGRGGIQEPTYKGEEFVTVDPSGKERSLLLIILETKREGRHGSNQSFVGLLWCVCKEYKDFLRAGDSLTAWIEFKGVMNFDTGEGWLEQVEEKK